MSGLKVYKELELPINLFANSLYLITDHDSPDHFTIYVTTSGLGGAAISARRLLNTEDIIDLIDNRTDNIKIVDTIISRNNLWLIKNTIVYVADIEELQIYNKIKDEWIKICNTNQDVLRVFNSSGTQIY